MNVADRTLLTQAGHICEYLGIIATQIKIPRNDSPTYNIMIYMFSSETRSSNTSVFELYAVSKMHIIQLS